MNLCPALRGGTHCEELAGHTPLEVGGRKWDHYAHSLGLGWQDEPAAEPTWETELTEALPTHAWFSTNGFDWNAVWTTRAGEWVITRTDRGELGRPALVHISGPRLECKVLDPTVEDIIAVLRLRGALDDPAVTSASPEMKRFLAGELAEYIGACAAKLAAEGGLTTHDEAHFNGMWAVVSWLYGELGLPVKAADGEDAAPDLLVEAWALIAKAHGCQPWSGAAPAWRDLAGVWRDDYRAWQDAPDARNVNPLLFNASTLITTVEGGNWDDAPLDWQQDAIAWRDRYHAWIER